MASTSTDSQFYQIFGVPDVTNAPVPCETSKPGG